VEVPGLRSILRIGYGLWCWTAFVVVALGTLLIGLPAPSLALRRRMARRGARLIFALAGIRFTVRGLEQLPPGPCVVVANHSSYLDGVIMQAALPPRFAFVIKSEMARVPVAGLLLRRLGSEFVDRQNRHQGGVDARRVLKTALAGESLAVFPEGTFTEAVGVHRFHVGAFVAAARAGLPVVPAAIFGARAVLPCYVWLMRRGPIAVEILPPLPAPGPSAERQAAMGLKDAARQAILARLGEPDLGA
jgi:1-acyl-sn-glycerol-3-phosphate acyltransferase